MNLFSIIDQKQDVYVDFLMDICRFEARAYDKKTLDAQTDFIAAFAEKQGFTVTRTPMEKCGDFLTVEINPGTEKCCMFQAHMDTVHDKGSFGPDPVRREADQIFGPGVIDCKGGIAVAMLAMKALLDTGYQKHIRLILTTDEEISNILGGKTEIRFITESAKGFPCAINCETAERNEVVVARKGILKYRLDITGEGGHAGKHFFQAKNAIVEAAHKTIALHESSKEGGTTYSCNIVKGGNVLNVIPDACTLSIDIRAVTRTAMAEAKETVNRIAQTQYLPGTGCQVTLLSERPPMEKTPETLDLLQKLLDVCHRYDLGTLTPLESGGGSDSCYTQGAGIPSICGVGASGGAQHTIREFVNIPSIPLRAKILAAFATE